MHKNARRYNMKRYEVILTEAEMRRLKRISNEYIPVDYIDKSNYKKYVGRKVNVIGDVCIQSLGLEEIPITFGKVGGYFDCSFNNISSLKGCPTEVGRGFDCSDNKLISLEGCPREVMRDFDCVSNRLTSLEGAPEKVGGYFDCGKNRLTSLEGAPKKMGRGFYCENNELTSLKGAPEKVGGNFYCWGNPEEFTVADVKAISTVGGDIEVSSGQ